MNSIETIYNWNPLLMEAIVTPIGEKVVSHKTARKLGTVKKGKRRLNDKLSSDELRDLRDTAQSMKLYGSKGEKKFGQKTKTNFMSTGKPYISGSLSDYDRERIDRLTK